MPFGVVGQVGPRMCSIDEAEVIPREWAILGWIWVAHSNQLVICGVSEREHVKRSPSNTPFLSPIPLTTQMAGSTSPVEKKNFRGLVSIC